MFSLLKSTNNLIKLIIGVILIVIIYNLIASKEASTPSNTKNNIELTDKKPQVTLITAKQYTDNNKTSLLGTVRALSEANIITERSGKITSVPTRLGQTVVEGQIIATLENARERAAVLQAEGVYEAAKAGASQGEVGLAGAQSALQTAQNKALTIYRNTFIALDNQLKNTIDKIFTDSSKNILSIRLKSQGKALELTADRQQITILMNKWSQQLNKLNIDKPENILNLIKEAKNDTKTFIDFVEKLAVVVNHSDNDKRLVDDKSISLYRSEFNAVRSSINNLLLNLENTEATLDSAQNNLEQSYLKGNETDSVTEAQVKQALGALRLAQASLQKTILRSPITGTVNSLSAKVGDFASAFTTLATVANNQTLEVITYLNSHEQSLLTVGDEVIIENKFDGVVTQISPALDKKTGKIEVRIITTTDELKNGETVRLQKKSVSVLKTDKSKNTKQVIKVPLPAVRLTAKDGFVLIVDENKKLQKKKVELGKIYGDSVEITSGLEADTEFVSDARGLIIGTEVATVQQ